MLRFLYTTDLHGDLRAYGRLPHLCKEHGVSVIVNGGDLLPKGRDMHTEQSVFLAESLPRFLDQCAAARVRYFALFGNDDLRAFHPDWLGLTHRRDGVHDLEERWYELDGGYWIRGNSFVPDYPFGLKDWCLRDTAESTPVPTKRSVTTTREGVELIEDPVAFFAARPTMGEHLESLVNPAVPMDRSILVSHDPPFGLGLGTLFSGQDVGSKAVRAFVEKYQPLLTLSGHIHESPDVGRALHGHPTHTTRAGHTTCHQPGQDLPHRFTYSIVELGTGDVPRVGIDWKQETLAKGSTD